MIGRFHLLLVALIVVVPGGCASLPSDSDFPKSASSALAHPEEIRLGNQLDNAAPFEAMLEAVNSCMLALDSEL